MGYSWYVPILSTPILSTLVVRSTVTGNRHQAVKYFTILFTVTVKLIN